MGKGYEKYVKRTINRNNKEVFMKEQKVAFITGVTGMDGSHLSDLLISKHYKVYGMIRRVTNRNY